MRYEAEKIKRQNGSESYRIEGYTIDTLWPVVDEQDRIKYIVEKSFSAGVQHAREQARLAFADLIDGRLVREEE